MDLAAFLECLDSRGGDLDTWPADVRAHAEAFMAGSVAAKAAFLATRDVERWLRASRVEARGPGADALAALAMRRAQDRSALRMARPAARAVFAAAAVIVLFLGLTLGWGSGQQDDSPDRVLAMAFDTSGAVDAD